MAQKAGDLSARAALRWLYHIHDEWKEKINVVCLARGLLTQTRVIYLHNLSAYGPDTHLSENDDAVEAIVWKFHLKKVNRGGSPFENERYISISPHDYIDDTLLSAINVLHGKHKIMFVSILFWNG